MQPQGVWQGETRGMLSTPHLVGVCPAVAREIAKTWYLISLHGGTVAKSNSQ